MGTHRRRGVVHTMIGNFTEKDLHSPFHHVLKNQYAHYNERIWGQELKNRPMYPVANITKPTKNRAIKTSFFP